MTVKPLTEHHLEFLSLKGGCGGSSESTYVKISHRLKSHALAHYVIDKRYFAEAFLFKPQGGRSPPSGLNRKPRNNPLSSL